MSTTTPQRRSSSRSSQRGDRRCVISAPVWQALPVPTRVRVPCSTLPRLLAADLAQRVALLNEHGEQLRDDAVGRYLRARNDSPRARAAVSLIELSRIGLHTDVVAAAGDDDLANSVLTRIAEQRDAKVLRQASIVLVDNAQEAAEPRVAVVATFFLAVGLLASELAAQGSELISIVTEAIPERLAGWKRLYERLATTRSEFAEVGALLDGRSAENG